MRASSFSVAVVCLLCAIQSQSYGEETDVVTVPAVVVEAAPLETSAAGGTRLSWDPGTAGSLSGWDELEQQAGNFHISAAGSGGYGSLFALRGLANTPYFSDPAVTVYLGDIPMPSSFAYPENVFDLSSVALYRGPEGSEFGRATDGGVVVFAPMAAGQATATYGAYDARSAVVSGGGDNALVIAGYSARDGYITNHQIGQRVDDQENENLFGQAAAPLSASDKLTVEIFGGRSRDGAQPLVPLHGPYYSVNRAQEGVTDIDSDGAALRFDAALPSGANLRSVTSFTDWRMDPFTNFLVLPPPLDSKIVQDQKTWNEELHATSGTLGPMVLSAGLWLSRSTTSNFIDRAIPGKFPIEISAFDEDSRQGAAFAQAHWTLAPGLSLTTGARAEATERDFLRTEAVPVPGMDFDGHTRYAGLLPKASLDWMGGADQHADLAAAWGLRPGGFSSYTDNPALIPFAAERLVSYSAGWDDAWDRRQWRLAVRVFDEEISNYQIERSYTAADYFVADARRAQSQGAEAELSWHPLAGLTVAASGGWTRAVLTSYASPITGADLSGDAAPYIPLYNGSLSVEYRPTAGWFAGVRATAVGRTYFDELESTAFEQHAYALLGARAGYAAAHWSITLFGENLTGRHYYELIIPGVNSGNPGAPMTGGVEFTLRR
ncbi:MAG TPA: TonB-dependent receptor [Opitutaceae bacterium]|jgi:iron complex outermembrane receptor protein